MVHADVEKERQRDPSYAPGKSLFRLDLVLPLVEDEEIERQLGQGASSIMVPADTVFSMVDLEECVSGARDARLSSSGTCRRDGRAIPSATQDSRAG